MFNYTVYGVNSYHSSTPITQVRPVLQITRANGVGRSDPLTAGHLMQTQKNALRTSSSRYEYNPSMDRLDRQIVRTSLDTLQPPASRELLLSMRKPVQPDDDFITKRTEDLESRRNDQAKPEENCLAQERKPVTRECPDQKPTVMVANMTTGTQPSQTIAMGMAASSGLLQ